MKIFSIVFRVVNPSLFAMGLVFFVLPWIEVSCPKGSGTNTPKYHLSQSGWEMATGKRTVLDTNNKPHPNPKVADADYPVGRGRCRRVPLVIAYAVVLLCMMVLSAALPWPWIRTGITFAGGALAALLLIIQSVVGFPIVDSEKVDVKILGDWSVTIWFIAAVIAPLLASASATAEWITMISSRGRAAGGTQPRFRKLKEPPPTPEVPFWMEQQNADRPPTGIQPAVDRRKP